ncbi:hypothetical protein NG796_17975 [Laspinema sp. A4]|uniref:hypothetical protein n=1 Tax=Laspinema sp. D2d TaxID=2953686 RepID=UPI0021BB6AC6|nr:hypothetical protein [Laspinema sp. D2d]MCT7985164.1 hypothetical protein [Laspinema sp. D2d]
MADPIFFGSRGGASRGRSPRVPGADLRDADLVAFLPDVLVLVFFTRFVGSPDSVFSEGTTDKNDRIGDL